MRERRLRAHAAHSIARHARPCAGHPRLTFFLRDEDVDGRVKPGHDGRMHVDLPVRIVEPSGHDEFGLLRRFALLAMTAGTHQEDPMPTTRRKALGRSWSSLPSLCAM